jgi:hypothetical protein
MYPQCMELHCREDIDIIIIAEVVWGYYFGAMDKDNQRGQVPWPWSHSEEAAVVLDLTVSDSDPMLFFLRVTPLCRATTT